jgi:nitrile hydratase
MRYGVGERVQVVAREHAGHHRTPGYLKGKIGTVERVHDSFANPETRAYGADGHPRCPLYLVSFAQRDIWRGYRGDARDQIYADLYEHWLEHAG